MAKEEAIASFQRCFAKEEHMISDRHCTWDYNSCSISLRNSTDKQQIIEPKYQQTIDDVGELSEHTLYNYCLICSHQNTEITCLMSGKSNCETSWHRWRTADETQVEAAIEAFHSVWQHGHVSAQRNCERRHHVWTIMDEQTVTALFRVAILYSQKEPL